MPYDPAFVALADRLDAYEEDRRGRWGALHPAMIDGAVSDDEIEAAIAKARTDRDDEAAELLGHLKAQPLDQRGWFADLHRFFAGTTQQATPT